MSEKKLFLLDGHALVYRAYYAFMTRPLINSKGMNTSAIAGFTRVLWDLIKKQQPSHLAVAFDLSGPTFRHEEYPEYKANREAQPEDISFALPYIQQILRGFNIPIVTVEGYEADDVIGALAKQAEKEGFKVYMMTPDKDFGQLVSDNIFLFKPARKGNEAEVLGPKEVTEKWDIERVDQVIDMLGLMGDSVDNIPGIPGIGQKTAAKLLKKYDSVEGLIAHVDELKGKQKENVQNFAEQGLLSKRLATIDLNVPIEFDATAYALTEPNKEVLGALFQELEFRTMAKQILGATIAQPGEQGDLFGGATATTTVAPTITQHSIAKNNIDTTTHEYLLVDTIEGCQELIEELSVQPMICFDTETTSIDANKAEIVGLSFAYQKGKAWYVPINNDDEGNALLLLFKPLLENDSIVKIGQNIKYDALVLKHHGIVLKGEYRDTMITHYLLEPGLRHGMDYLAETYLKYKPISIKTLIGSGKKQLSMRDVAIAKVVDYAAEDADITWQLYEELYPKIEEEKLYALYKEMEEPLIKVLVDLEYEGINLDVEALQVYSKELEKGIAEMETKIYETAGVKFNIASPKQVGEVLFDRMEIPYRWKKTKSGQYSTNEEKLAELAKDHAIVNDILRFRSLAKLKSTYVDALPLAVNTKTGRVHSSFNQALAATGRLSSNDPNLQNIPIRTEEGARIRKAFIPRDENHVLVAADYSQIELRLIAEMSGDETMIQTFVEGLDVHRATAAGVFDVPYEEVTKEQRYRAKAVNFSIIYGAGATNLSKQLDIKRTEAKKLIESYFERYQGLKSYMEKVVAQAREAGFVTTLKGRRRYLRDINSRNGIIRSHAERNAINSPVQGSAADLIKIAMINIHQALKDQGLKTKMILQVHDELVFDVPKEELETVKVLINDLMVNAMPELKVPMVVEVGVGQNWLEAH